MRASAGFAKMRARCDTLRAAAHPDAAIENLSHNSFIPAKTVEELDFIAWNEDLHESFGRYRRFWHDELYVDDRGRGGGLLIRESDGDLLPKDLHDLCCAITTAHTGRRDLDELTLLKGQYSTFWPALWI